MRASTDEDAYGLTSILLVLIIMIGLRRYARVFKKQKIFLSLAIMMLWVAGTSILSTDLGRAFFRLANFAPYILFSAAAYSVSWSEKRLKTMLLILLFAGAISSAATLIDWYGVVKIPRVNERSVGADTGMGLVFQTSGPFTRRTGMAAFYCLLIPVAAIVFLETKRLAILTRCISLFVFVGCLLSLIISQNRAGVLSSLFAVCVYGIWMARNSLKILRFVVIALLFTFLSLAVLRAAFPEQLFAYQKSLGLAGLDKSEETQESDKLRGVLFLYALESLAENPVGNGYTELTGFGDGDLADPHNNITQVIWAAGLLGIVWLIWFIPKIIKNALILQGKRYSGFGIVRYTNAIACGLLSFSLCGMMHTILGTGLAWFLFGLFLKTGDELKRDSLRAPH